MRFCIKILIFLIFEIIKSSYNFNKVLISNFNLKKIELSKKNEYLWGPYNSKLFFELRSKTHNYFFFGLMWFKIDNYNSNIIIRHQFDNDQEIKKAKWVLLDPRYGGRQIIEDLMCQIKIYIDFVKSEDGNSWAVKIKGKPLTDNKSIKYSFVLYTGFENHKDRNVLKNNKLNLENSIKSNGYDEIIKLNGSTNELGNFDLKIKMVENHNEIKKKKHDNFVKDYGVLHSVFKYESRSLWKKKEIFTYFLKEKNKILNEKSSNFETYENDELFLLKNQSETNGNLHFIQKIFQNEGEFNVIFNSEHTPDIQKITFDEIESKINKTFELINSKFDKFLSFEKHFNIKKYKQFGKEVLSNLFGGLSYRYDDYFYSNDVYNLRVMKSKPVELFTFVPSRISFPNGFLWDEGFHLLIIVKYDPLLTLEILKSWYNTITHSGWIPREQILGIESRSRMDDKFVIQNSNVANPPTLLIPFKVLLESYCFDYANEIDLNQEINTIDDQSYRYLYCDKFFFRSEVKNIYVNVEKHYNWMRKTQKVNSKLEKNDEHYLWKGQTLNHCLPSGMDDYPRNKNPSNYDLNVDLISWIGAYSEFMVNISKYLKHEKNKVYYENILNTIVKNIETHYWNDKKNLFCDLVYNNLNYSQFCETGYLSFLPFVTKLINQNSHERISKILGVLLNPDELWSEYGIRSLSKSSIYYKKDEDYWRSSIWINFNYLILESLVYYEKNISNNFLLKKKMRFLIENLRNNLVKNVFKNWENTDTLWENYDDVNGSFKGAKSFFGWTSLIILIMKFPNYS